MLVAFIKKIHAIVIHAIRHHSFFSVNTGHQKLLFPCCSLTEGDPTLALEVYSYLKKEDPQIGVWQDCCGMPLVHNNASTSAEKTKQFLLTTVRNQNITELITPCTTCYQRFQGIFRTLAHPPKITILYDRLDQNISLRKRQHQPLVVHHPCPARGNKDLQRSFAELCKRLNLKIQPADNQKHPLSCCLVKTPPAQEKVAQQKNKPILTYCAHCVQEFEPQLDIVHVLELLFVSDKPIKKASLLTKLKHLRKFKKQVSRL